MHEEEEEEDVIHVTAQWWFGKSTNTDIIKKFTEIVVNKKGNPVYNVQVDKTGKLKEKRAANTKWNY